MSIAETLEVEQEAAGVPAGQYKGSVRLYRLGAGDQVAGFRGLP